MCGHVEVRDTDGSLHFAYYSSGRSLWRLQCTVGLLLLQEMCVVAHMLCADSHTWQNVAEQPCRHQLLASSWCYWDLPPPTIIDSITYCSRFQPVIHAVCNMLCVSVSSATFTKVCFYGWPFVQHWLQIPSLDNKYRCHLSNWLCPRLCHHLFQVQTCAQDS